MLKITENLTNELAWAQNFCVKRKPVSHQSFGFHPQNLEGSFHKHSLRLVSQIGEMHIVVFASI